MIPRLLRCAVLVALAAAAAAPASPPTAAPVKPAEKVPFVVHEWGTFLQVQGSDGVALGGMVASEAPLPSFVVERNLHSFQRTLIFSKMETPVTYFYTDRPLRVQVRVDMPRGVLTHWFPMVRHFTAPTAKPDPKGTYLEWQNVDLIPAQLGPKMPAGTPVPVLWRVKGDDPWEYARQTDSAYVKTFSPGGDMSFDYEKFLFYRGLGTFSLPLAIASQESGAGATLALHNRGRDPITGVFLIQVEPNTIAFARLSDLSGDGRAEVTLHDVLSKPVAAQEGVPAIKREMVKSLVASGLFEREAWAMVNTWEKSYFRTPGLRMLYALPRSATNQYIPLTITPKPDNLVRVMVGRTEILTPQIERQIERWVADLDAPDARTRETASAGLAKLGRIGEPALRRVLVVTHSAEVRNRARALLREVEAK